MSKLPAVNGRDTINAFRRAGFSVVRTKGSHHVMKKGGHPNTLIVPVHGNSTIPPGTLRDLIKKAELTVDEFVAFLK